MLPKVFDEPFGDSSAIPTLLVSKFAKEKVKVALSADGADELFYGYERYETLFRIDKMRRNKSFILVLLKIIPNNIIYFLIKLVKPWYSPKGLFDKIIKMKNMMKSDSVGKCMIH